MSAGRGLLIFVGAQELGRVPAIALCEVEGEVLAVHCDEAWDLLEVAACPSVERCLDAQLPRCRFCGKRAEEFESMIRSERAAICNRCIDALHGEIHRQ